MKNTKPKKAQNRKKNPNQTKKNPHGSDNLSTWNGLINKWLGNKELRFTE